MARTARAVKKPTTIEVVGSRLRSRRQELGLTVFAVAVTSGVSTTTITRLEAGRQAPTIDRLEAIAKSVEMSLGELFEGVV